MAMETRFRMFLAVTIITAVNLLALVIIGRPTPLWLIQAVARPHPQAPPWTPPHRPYPELPYPVQDMVIEPQPYDDDESKFSVAATSTTIACLNGAPFNNANLVISISCMFNTGNLNVTNSTITFNGRVQFFSTEQYIYLSSDSTWTFNNATDVMVYTYWMGTGTFAFGKNSSLTVTSSNTLTIKCTAIFNGTVTVGNTRTKLLMNGPSLLTGTLILVDRTSEYVCQTYPWLGRCILNGATVVSQATDLTGWRIAQQLECRGGIMMVNNCTIGSQTTLPFDLILLSTPQWTMLNIYNVTRASLFCGTKFGSTAFSDTTVFMVDTTCTYWNNTNWSNVASPFVPSDGFVIEYGTLVFANVTKTSKGLLITNGYFSIEGTSLYVDVKATGKDSWTIVLMQYNSTPCKTDWDDFITIQGCPSYSTCICTAATLPSGQCVLYFHYNDWFESNQALWWLLFLVLAPLLCLCCFCCCWCRGRKRKEEMMLRDEPAPAAELAYGRENLAGRAVNDHPALHQINHLRPPDELRPTSSTGTIPVPAVTPTARAMQMDSVFGPLRDMQADSVFAPQQQKGGGNAKI